MTNVTGNLSVLHFNLAASITTPVPVLFSLDKNTVIMRACAGTSNVKCSYNQSGTGTGIRESLHVQEPVQIRIGGGTGTTNVKRQYRYP